MSERTPEGGVRWRADPHHAESEYPENRQWLEVWSPEGQRLYRRPTSGNVALGPAPVWSQEAPGPVSLTWPGALHTDLPPRFEQAILENSAESLMFWRRKREGVPAYIWRTLLGGGKGVPNA